MIKIIEFAKKHSWIWVIFIVLIAIIGDAILTQKRKALPSSTPAPIASFNSITPGISSETDLNKVLGTPLKTTTANGVKTDEYKSKSPIRNTIGIIENGKVVLIREIVASSETTNASSITDIYGQPPEILYSKAPNSLFNLYVYPSSGIAYLGAPDGTLLEIWYFIPTTIDNILTTWATDYQTSKPEQVQ